MSSHFKIGAIYLLTCATPLAYGVEASSSQIGQGGQAGSLTKTAGHGPVKMSVSLDRDRITPAGRFDLVVEVFAPENVQVVLPSLSGDVAGLAIRDHREYPAVPTREGRLWRQEYRIDALLVGEHTIPELTATFADLRLGTDAMTEGEVTIDGFTVTVESRLPPDIDLTAFRDIKGPVPLASSPARMMWLGYTVAAMAGVVVLAWVFLRLSRQGRQAPSHEVLPAHEWALSQLRRLTKEQLIERGLVREFYFRLNFIVRQYIALQFRLTALEWTTEELLQEPQKSTGLSARHQELLAPFLTACDMVKFARHTPGTEQIDGAFNAAWVFVSQPAGSVTEGSTTA